MSSRDDRRARELARSLKRVEGLKGVPLWQDGELWVLSEPAARPTEAASLAAALVEPTLSNPHALARMLGARKVWRAHAGGLATAAYHLGLVSSHADRLAGLVEAGHKPLRAWRGVDFEAFIRASRARLEVLKLCLNDPLGTHAEDNLLRRGLSLCATIDARKRAPGDVERLLPWLGDEHPEALRRWVLARIAVIGRRSPEIEGRLPRGCVLAWRLMRDSAVRQIELLSLAQADAVGLEAALETFAGLSVQVLADLAPACHRVGVVYGGDVGWSVWQDLSRKWRGESLGILPGRDLLRAFSRAVRVHQRSPRHPAPNVRSAVLFRGLEALPRLREPAIRSLIRLLREWMGSRASGAFAPSHTRQRRAAASVWHLGVARSAQALAQCWLDELREVEDKGSSQAPEPGWLEAALGLRLMNPGLRLADLLTGDEAGLKQHRKLIEDLPEPRVRELAPMLAGLSREHLENPGLRGLVQSSLPGAQIQRGLGMGIRVGCLNRFTERPDRLSDYLDVVSRLPEDKRDFAGLDIDSMAFVNIFTQESDLGAELALTLLGRAGLARGRQRDVERLVVLGQAIQQHNPALREALERWGRVDAIDRPPEYERLRAALGVSEASLDTYLHHRGLAGEPVTFSEALLKPLRQTRRGLAQRVWLEEKLGEADLDSAQRDTFSTRLARLNSPEGLARLEAAGAQRARSRLTRATERLRQESLLRVLDTQMREAIGRALGSATLPEPLPSGLDLAVLLLHANHLDRSLWRALLRGIIFGEDLRQRAENIAWEARATVLGVDIDGWSAGLKVTLPSDEVLVLATEHDPIEILRMGSYFGTCLSLESGANAASTVANAIDANKQVVYLRREDGAVVGRKLICVTARGDLIGYQTYLHTPYMHMAAAIHAAILSFASSCGLKAADTGFPENLCGAFWYDDGVEAWIAGWRATTSVEAVSGMDFPQDTLGQSEALWCAATTTDDEALRVELLRELVVRDKWPYRASSAELLWRDTAIETASLPALNDFVRGALSIAGDTRWWGVGRGARCGYEDLACHLMALKPTLPCARALAAQARLAAQRPAGHRGGVAPPIGHDALIEAPAGLALLPLRELMQLAADMLAMARRDHLVCLTEAHQNCISAWCTTWARALEVAAARDGAEPLARWLGSDEPLLARIAHELVLCVSDPALARPLRRALKRAQGPQRPKLALALGAQSLPQDAHRLMTMLRRDPTSLEVAVSVVRTGEPGAAQEARALWRPPADLEAAVLDVDWCALAAELDPPSLGEALGACLDGKTKVRFGALRLLLALSSPCAEEVWSRWPTGRAVPAFDSLRGLVAERRRAWCALRDAGDREQLATAATLCEEIEVRRVEVEVRIARSVQSLSGGRSWCLPAPAPARHRLWGALVHLRGQGQRDAATLLLDLGDGKTSFERAGLVVVVAREWASDWPLEIRKRLAVEASAQPLWQASALFQAVWAMGLLTDEEYRALLVDEGLSGGWDALDALGVLSWWREEGEPDAKAPSLLRRVAMGLFEDSPHDALGILSAMMGVLPADKAEAWATEVLSAVSRRDIPQKDALDSLRWNGSFRLDRLLLEKLVEDRPRSEVEQLVADIETEILADEDVGRPRKAWLRRQLSEMGLIEGASEG